MEQQDQFIVKHKIQYRALEANNLNFLKQPIEMLIILRKIIYIH